MEQGFIFDSPRVINHTNITQQS